MDELHIAEQARGDFNKARFKDFLLNLKNFVSPEQHELLSFKEVRKMVKSKGEVYKGMQVVQLSRIAGSEGRYRDFNKAFLPRHDFLRYRWERVDRALIKDVALPSIKLFEVGGLYFVRDGNHRVSVAKMQGVKAIDAEVTSLNSEIKLKPNMTRTDLKKAVIEYEKDCFFKETNLDSIILPDELIFSATGRYDEVMLHILVHKYYINQSLDHEILLEEAAKSWKENLFDPIVMTVRSDNILARFPGRTVADLYVWIVRHWDELKQKYGEDFSIADAVQDYSVRYGKSVWQRLKEQLGNFFARKA